MRASRSPTPTFPNNYIMEINIFFEPNRENYCCPSVLNRARASRSCRLSNLLVAIFAVVQVTCLRGNDSFFSSSCAPVPIGVELELLLPL